jgi:hypothetical protein
MKKMAAGTHWPRIGSPVVGFMHLKLGKLLKSLIHIKCSVYTHESAKVREAEWGAMELKS